PNGSGTALKRLSWTRDHGPRTDHGPRDGQSPKSQGQRTKDKGQRTTRSPPPRKQMYISSVLKPIVFRFCVIYFGLYAAATQILGGVLLLPGFQLPALGTVWPLRDLTLWAAQHVFGLTTPLIYTGNSGDTAFHWVQTALLLAIATTATAIWSAHE